MNTHRKLTGKGRMLPNNDAKFLKCVFPLSCVTSPLKR